MKKDRNIDSVSGPRAIRRVSNRNLKWTMGGILGLSLVLLGCGSGDADGASSETLPLSVEGLLEAEPSGSVDAVGFVVIDSSGARLCFALAESFPPQCGGGSVEIVNPDALDVVLEESGAVQWTDSAVVVTGRYSQETFTIEASGS